MSSLRYCSLFSGIGGFEIGVHRAFPDAECVGYSEIDPNALKILKTRFPEHSNLGPVQDIDGKVLRFDLLVGGSPCQDLSGSNVKSRFGAKKDTGLKGKKSGLFYEYVRILNESKPRYFILENVNSMKNQDKSTISQVLGVQPIMVNSCLFTPQNRKRLFWTNIPLTEDDRQFLESGGGKVKINDILIPKKEALGLIIDTNKSKLYQSYLKKMEKYGSALRMALVDSDASLSPSLLAGRTMWINDKRIGAVRKMSPVEAERLHSFPDNWTNGISDTARFKALGNAVTCEVVHFFMDCLKRNG